MLGVKLGSRRKPYPWGGYLANIPVMWKRDQAGKDIYATKSISLENVAPNVWDYQASSPYKQRTYPFKGLELGAGQTTEKPGPSVRYREAINVDWSLGYGIKGHYFHRISPTNKGAVRDFCEALDGGTLKLFVLSDRYVNKINADDSVSLSKDLGAGVHGRQMVRYEGSGGGPVDALYVAVDSGNFQQYDGSAWHAGPFNVRNFEARREELWGADSANSIRKVVADPLTGADWAAAVTIGDASGSINWLRQNLNQLFIFKTNGVFSLDVEDDGSGPLLIDTDLFPAGFRSPNNGLNASAWGSSVWTPFENGLAEVSLNDFNNPTMRSIPLAWSMDPEAETRGRPVDADGHGRWVLYVALYNEKNGHSYLGKYLGQRGGEDVFHVAIKKWTSKQVTKVKVWGRAGENERLYVGFADGDVDWCWLPKMSPDPTVDSVCEFNTDDGFVRWPLHHMNFEAVDKLWRGFSAFGPKLDADNYVTQDYRTDTAADYASLADSLVFSGQHEDLSPNVTGKALDCRTHLTNTATTATPIVEGVGLDEQLRPDDVVEYQMTVDCRLTASRNGTRSRLTPEQVRDAILTLVQSKGAVSCLLPDETVQELTFIDHGAALDSAGVRSGLSYDLPLKAVQLVSEIDLGTYERWEAWSYDAWESLTYEEWERI